MNYDLGFVKVSLTHGKPGRYIIQVMPKYPGDRLRVVKQKGVVVLELKVK